MNNAAPKSHRRIVTLLLLVVFGMFGFGYALVPLYDVFCELTGINGKPTRMAASQEAMAHGVDKNRSITVEFVATLNKDLPWQFKPMTSKMVVHPGELNTVSYVAANTSQRDVVAHAIPSVSPGLAAGYFSKTECFCFTEQKLAAGESREMPVRFVIDPGIPENIRTVTLSYTFFEKPNKP